MDFHRHAGAQLERTKAGEFGVGEIDPHRIIGFLQSAGRLLPRQIRRDASEAAKEFGRRALVEGTLRRQPTKRSICV